MGRLGVILVLLLAGEGATFDDRTAEEWAAALDGEGRAEAIRRLIDGGADAIPVLWQVFTRRPPSHVVPPSRDLAWRILHELPPEAAPKIPHPLIRMRVAPTEENAQYLLSRAGVPSAGYDLGRALAPLGDRAVTLLLERLAKQTGKDFRDYMARASLMMALGEFGSGAAPAVPELVRQLEKLDPMASRHAMIALGAIGAPARPAAPRLKEILETGRTHAYRSEAASALGRIRDTAAIPVLIGALAKERQTRRGTTKSASPSTTRAAVATAIGEYGPAAKRAIPALLQTIRDGKPVTRIAAAASLTKVGGDLDHAVEILTGELVSAENWWLAEKASMALAELGPAAAAAVPALIRGLESSTPPPIQDARDQIAFVLGRIGPAAESAIPALVRGIKESEFRGAVYAFALWLVGGDREKALAEVRTNSPFAFPWLYAVRAVEDLGNEAIHLLPLIVTWYSEGAWLDDDFVKVMVRFGPKAAPVLPELVELLDSPWSAKRRSAAIVLAVVGSKKAVPALTKRLTDRRPEVRVAAARALGDLEAASGETVAALVRLLHDDAVHEEAAAVLVRMGEPAVDPVLSMPPDTPKPVRERAFAVLVALEKHHACVVPALLVPPHGGPGHRMAEDLMVRMGEVAVTSLQRAAAGDDERIAKWAEDTLQRIQLAGAD